MTKCKYDVKGMTCAACSARVEKAVNSVEGVEKAEVNLLLNSMTVEFSSPATSEKIRDAVSKAGYAAFEEGKADEKAKPSEVPDEKKRIVSLIVSVVLTLVLTYVCMFRNMFSAPLPSFLENPVTLALLQLVLSAIVLIVNGGFFIRGFKAAIHLSPNMDTLVALGSGTAFLYSLIELFIMTATHEPEHYLHSLYFETAAMILTLISVGKLLEAKSKGKTANAINSLIDLAPQKATLWSEDGEKEINADDLKAGDVFIVKPGQAIPADGVVIKGNGAVNESALTGESMPVDKEAGDKVNAATINLNGAMICRAEKVGAQTNFSLIVETVKQASAGKAPIARLADKVAGVFVPVVLGIALVTALVWGIVSRDVEFTLARAISVLVISCPCALGLATPVAIMAGGGRGAKSGILYKTAAIMENASKVKIVAFDKTGTLTNGKPTATGYFTSENVETAKLLQVASSLEALSEHPIAKAIADLAEEKAEVRDFKAITGFGVEGIIEGKKTIGGNLSLMERNGVDVSELKNKADEEAEKGRTPVYFAEEDRLLGLIVVADVLKKDAKETIAKLKEAGIATVMLTGDNSKTARAIAAEVGVDKVFAELLPVDKSEVIKELQKAGKVAMVGDGINDAPSLTVADIGIAIGRGADVAIDAADVVLTSSSTLDVVKTLKLSKTILRVIKQNLFWAFFYNAVGIPLAAGVFVPVGVTLPPMFGALAMSVSSFCVVMNALRLNRINVDNIKINKDIIYIDDNIDIKEDEEYLMKKVLKVEGMMCEHCKARVEKALESVEDVEKVKVDLKDGTATVKSKVELSDDVLKKAVEDQGYKVTEIK